MKTVYINIFSLIFITFSSCSKIKSEKNILIHKTKNKISKTSDKVWKKSVEKTFEYSTTIENSKIENIYRSNDFEIQNEEGKKIEYIGNFYQCFYTYNGNINKVLEFLDNLQTKHPEISSKEYSISDNKMINEKLKFIKSKFPKLFAQLNFFTEFENEKNLTFYHIDKYPNSNIIILNNVNGKIYHFIENYKD